MTERERMLLEALEPFAKFYNIESPRWHRVDDDCALVTSARGRIVIGDLRRAAKAVQEAQAGEFPDHSYVRGFINDGPPIDWSKEPDATKQGFATASTPLDGGVTEEMVERAREGICGWMECDGCTGEVAHCREIARIALESSLTKGGT